MGLVTYALKFRITFYVMSILILLAGIGGYIVMPKDVLPEVNIPVVTIVWTYTGLDTPEIEQRVNIY
jgi:multidrug efflux pump subunit AcrB